MNIEAYNSIRLSHDGCTASKRDIGLLRVTGVDAAAFLNGQVTSNTIDQMPGKSVNSCLLNNVGHMISDLVIHRLSDEFWIETPSVRAEIVAATLNRFIVREKVRITDLKQTHASLSIQGPGATETLVRALSR